MNLLKPKYLYPYFIKCITFNFFMPATEQNSSAETAIFVRSEKIEPGTPEVRGYDFNDGVDYVKIISSFKQTGFQATNLANAIEEINKMVILN